MLIDLIEILQHNDAEKTVEAKLYMKDFTTSGFKYSVIDSDFSFRFNKVDKKNIHVECSGEAVLEAPCFKCLDTVQFSVNIDVSRDMDMSKTAEERIADLDEENYLSGTVFDTELFVFDEILVNLPMKVLCSDSCKGVCNRCGANLNRGFCDCDTAVPDPRMSKILDVFNQFKEV